MVTDIGRVNFAIHLCCRSATYSRITLERLKNAGEIDMVLNLLSFLPLFSRFLVTPFLCQVWHVGDIGYVDDSYAHHLTGLTYESAYNGYMNWLQNVTALMPYMVSPGNHESECHSPACALELSKYGHHLNNFTAFNARWKMPSQESKGRANSNMWCVTACVFKHFSFRFLVGFWCLCICHMLPSSPTRTNLCIHLPHSVTPPLTLYTSPPPTSSTPLTTHTHTSLTGRYSWDYGAAHFVSLVCT